MGEITYQGRQFYKDGKPHRIFAGAIHFFRVLPETWHDRMAKLKNCGFNAVETYVCWSLHERKEGVFDFTGRLDLARFIDCAKELGLDVILRPGPYICTETDFGGLPSWLLNYGDIELRCNNATYMEKVTHYFKELAKIIVPRLAKNGGNVVMMQVENEYGSFGNDKAYKQALIDLYRDCGFDTLLFTADGAEPLMLEGGKIDGVMQALTFGSRPKENMKILEDRIDQPLVCMEFWNGWFDCWGEPHYTRAVETVVNDVKEFLELGASFNFYMFSGGTNFGLTNGANVDPEGGYHFQVSSYDFGAPIDESGDLTEKYYAIQKLLEPYVEKSDLPVKKIEKKAYGKLKAEGYAPLMENLSLFGKSQKSNFPMTFEALGVDFGYALYSTTARTAEEGKLRLRGLRDRAVVLVNGKIRGVAQHNVDLPPITLTKEDGNAKIDILVENMGRCNYGWNLKDRKGILTGVAYCDKYLMGFENRPIVMDYPKGLTFRKDIDKDAPFFAKFNLTIEGEPKETYLYPVGFKKGCAFVNGQPIGRYYNLSFPQKTLYVPSALLKEGDNEILLFETDGETSGDIELLDKHVLDGTGDA